MSQRWTVVLPPVALLVLVLAWGRHPGGVAEALLVTVVAVALVGAVLTAVHHAEVVAHRVGEPFGSLVLAVAVTVIEVALIVTLMVSGGKRDTSTLARDTVFAAVMISLNGIVGLSLLVGALQRNARRLQRRGHGEPPWRPSSPWPACAWCCRRSRRPTPGPVFSAGAARLRRDRVAGAVRPASSSSRRCATATSSCPWRPAPTPTGAGRRGRRRARRPADRSGGADQPGPAAGRPRRRRRPGQGRVPRDRGRRRRARLPAVVRRRGDRAAGAAAGVDRGGACRLAGPGCRRASTWPSARPWPRIGLTIPTLALASIWLDGPLALGLGTVQMVLLLLTVLVAVLTVVPGRAKPLQGGVHLVLLSAFVFLSISP